MAGPGGGAHAEPGRGEDGLNFGRVGREVNRNQEGLEREAWLRVPEWGAEPPGISQRVGECRQSCLGPGLGWCQHSGDPGWDRQTLSGVQGLKPRSLR